MIAITEQDYTKLTTLIHSEMLSLKMPMIANKLSTSFEQAERLAPEKIHQAIITMNSTVLLRDTKTGRETEITVAYPNEADAKLRRISIFSEIGVALLGKREKDIVSWKTPMGLGKFEIVKVTYQPEAAGHYHL
jgi:regulator of nucleoside diphosphate kinase